MTTRAQRIQEVQVSTVPAWPWPTQPIRPYLAAERLEEEQQERNQQHVNDERFDQDETEDECASHVTSRSGVPRDGFSGRADRLALAERRESCRDPEGEAGGNDRPFGDLEVQRGGPLGRSLREHGGKNATRKDQYDCQDETFTHDPSLL